MSSTFALLVLGFSVLCALIGLAVMRAETIGRRVFIDGGLPGTFDQEELGALDGPTENAKITRGIQLRRDSKSGNFSILGTGKYDSEYYR